MIADQHASKTGGRRRSSSSSRFVAVVIAVLLSPTPTFAAGNGPRARLVYSAPNACPNENQFAMLLAPHSDVVFDPAASLTLFVRITRDQRGHRGRVSLVASKEEGAREVIADRCEDVVRGLALFSAIALDAHFEHRRKDVQKDLEEEPLAAEGPPPREEPGPTGVPMRSPVAKPAVIAPAEAEHHRHLLGLVLGQEDAAGTRLVRYLGAFVELEIHRTWRTSLRASLNVGGVIPQSFGGGALWLGMGWTRLDVCPMWAELAPTLLASLCPAGELGLQRAALDGAAGGAARVRPWISLGGVGRLRTRLGHTVELETSGGVFAPLLPFDFRTLSGLAYTTPRVGVAVELGLVVPLF